MKLIVAATGGVAALKTPSLLRRLHEAGHEVRAAATDGALHFVTRLSLAVAAGDAVFDREAWFAADGQARHIDWARWADALLVAPATANALAGAATGRGDDVVSALILAGVPSVIWAPAMNTAMWQHPATRQNRSTLLSWGHRFIGPVSGPLAARGEGEGMGRMVEPEAIVAQLEGLFKPKDFEGLHVLVSAGPTREYLDPVRYLSNPSSGKMGYALARAARERGARVTLVSGPTGLESPPGAELVAVESAQQMTAALQNAVESADILLMSAAVADWRAADISKQKEPKRGERKQLELVRTPDILSDLKPHKGRRVFVGFAMETEHGVERAAQKARDKALDFICLNYPTRAASAFGGDDNQVTVVRPTGEAEALPSMPKLELAHKLLDRVKALTAAPD